MLQADLPELDRECHVFGRFLINEVPDAYIVEKYKSGHKAGPDLNEVETSRFDRILVRIATVHPWTTRLVESYCRMFVPDALVRKKCILLLAILECSPATHAIFDSPDSGGESLVYAKVLKNSLVFLLMICLGMALLMPLQFVFGRRGTYVGNR